MRDTLKKLMDNIDIVDSLNMDIRTFEINIVPKDTNNNYEHSFTTSSELTTTFKTLIRDTLLERRDVLELELAEKLNGPE